MENFIGHLYDPNNCDDNAFGIYVNERRMFGSPSIGCALNMWQFAKITPWYHGAITIRDRNGIVLYHYKKY